MTRDLPEGWEDASSSDLFAFITSGSRGWSKYYAPSGPAFIRVGNLDRGTISLDVNNIQCVQPPVDAEGIRTRIKPNDVLISITADIGMVAVAPSDIGEAYVNQHVALARPHQTEFSRYLGWYMASPAGQKQLGAFDRGVTKAGLGLDDIRNVTVPLPPLAEQRRIVDKIEALTARSRNAREALAAVPGLIERYRQSLLAAAFRGDLTAEWRAAHPHAETADAFLRRLGWAADEVETDERPLELPATWQWARLDDIADVKGGLAKGKKRPDSGQLTLIPYLRVANVQRGYLDLTEIKEIEATPGEIAQLLLRPGDILFNEGGDRDKLGRGWVWSGEIDGCIHQNHVFRARLKSQEFNAHLISHFGNTFGQRYFFGEAKQSVNLASISMSKLRALPVPIIPPAEQTVLIDRLQQALRRIDAFLAAWRVASDHLPTLDSAILAKAFRGELVPQDPNDEPASVLLDRIRAERAAAGSAPRRGRRKKEDA